MVSRIVSTEEERDMLLKLIANHKLPFTANVVLGKKRSNDQNQLQRLWMGEIADQLSEHSAEEWRGYCKLHHGVPIMRNEDEDFRAAYDRVVRPLPYEHKLLAMMVPLDMPVTRMMNSRQKTAYLDAIQRDFASRGVILTDPSGALGQLVRAA